MSLRDMLEKAGRLTSGNAPLHVRRKHLTNTIRSTSHSVRTSMANWPAEYEFPPDHPIHELLDVMDYICDQIEEPPCSSSPSP